MAGAAHKLWGRRCPIPTALKCVISSKDSPWVRLEELEPRLKKEELVGFLSPSPEVQGVICFTRILQGFYLRECLLL